MCEGRASHGERAFPHLQQLQTRIKPIKIPTVQEIVLKSLDIFKKMSIIIIRTYVPRTSRDLPKGQPAASRSSETICKERKACQTFLSSFFVGSRKEVHYLLDNEAYICRGCGHGFREPSSSGGEFTCPECGCTDLAEAKTCSVCGEILPASEFEDSGDGELCGDCRRAAQYFFRMFLGKWFTRAEVNYLNKVYEGHDLGEGIERFGCT